MKRSIPWIVLALCICLVIGLAPAEAARGGSSSGGQGSSGSGSPGGSTSFQAQDGISSFGTGPGGVAQAVSDDRGAGGNREDLSPNSPGASGEPGQSLGTGSPGENGSPSEQDSRQGPSAVGESPGSHQGSMESTEGAGGPREPFQGRSGSSPGRVAAATGQDAGNGRFAIVGAFMGSAGVARSGFGSPGGLSPFGDPFPASLPGHHGQGSPAPPGRYPCGPAQTIPVLPAQGTAKGETGDENSPRPRSKRTRILYPEMETPRALPSFTPPQGFSSLGFLLFGGYRRISRKNVLTQEARNRIHAAITRYPGIDVTALAGLTGINENTLRYHLMKLISHGKVTSLIHSGIARYFPNQGAYSIEEQVVLHYLWTETPREILLLISREPGLTRHQISDTLSISGPSVTRQMDHLIGDGIVENRNSGKSNHYFLRKDAEITFGQLVGLIPPEWLARSLQQPARHPEEGSIPEFPGARSPATPPISGL